MAVIKIEAKKDTRCTQTICLIQGDRRTQILRFGVNRFDGGVDLSDLVWVIKTVNANGVEDVFGPAAVEIGENRITIDWLVEGSVTDADGLAKYELNGLDAVGEEPYPVIWRGGTGTISLRASINPKFGESDGMTNIEKLILYVDGELQNVIDAGSAAADAAARANRAADNVEDLSGAVERANTAAQRATDAAAAVEDLEGAVTRANSAATLATDSAMNADMAASMAYSAATRATEAAKNVENIEEATVAAYDAADDARMAAEVANTAGLPAAMIYGRRVMGETANTTGNPVSFLPDAGSLLQPVTVLEPKQSGSGDPYPAGGGRNLIPSIVDSRTHNGMTFTKNLDGSIVVNGTATGYTSASSEAVSAVALRGKTVTLKGANAGNIAVTQIVFVCDSGTVYKSCTPQNGAASYTFDVPTDANTMQFEVYSVSGQVATNLTVYPQLELGSESSTYAPYSNIRPITGYDKLNLNHAGKNLCSDHSLNQIGWTTLVPELTETLNALPKGVYTLSMYFTAVNVSSESDLFGFLIEGDDRNNIVFELKAWGATTAGTEKRFTVSVDTSQHDIGRVFVYGCGNNKVGATGTANVDRFQIEAGSIASDFQPYQGTLHTVQIGQTVYGIRYEWLTGKGMIEWAGHVFDGTEDIGAQDDYGSFYTPNEPLGAGNSLCSHAWARGNEWFLGGGIAFITGLNRVIFYNSLFGASNRDEFVAILAAQHAAGTPVQIAYKLKTPIEIQLTPHIISAVEPEQNNTLYGDGSIEVDYVKPLHVSIEERVAAALAAASE